MHDRVLAFTADGWSMECIESDDLLAHLADNDIFPAEAAMTCLTNGCGTALTGGGAGRGWVLLRIVGDGEPRRYCSRDCATQALAKGATVTPIKPERVQGNASKGRGAQAAAERIRSLGVKPAQIREWAILNGRMNSPRGIIPGPVVDAWIDAHRGAAS